MARSLGTSIENNFVRGLITEATGLNFPENACTDTMNCVFEQTGKVTRRKGINFEADYSTVNYHDYSSGSGVVSEYIWENVGGQGDLTFVVLQIGYSLLFYQPSSDSLSPNKKSFTVDLRGFSSGYTTDIEKYPVQIASGNEVLYVTHRFCEPFYIWYDVNSDYIETGFIFVRVRDTEGIDDSLNTESRPNSLSVQHRYNLSNQGWYGAVENVGGVSDPIVYWNSSRGDYPSNADIWWIYKNADEQFNISYVNRFSVGNSPAPRGKYILDVFNKDRSYTSGFPGIPVESSNGERPQVVSFHAGRVFYAGCNFSGLSTKIFFSQILDKYDKAGNCYQVNDPTSEHQADLLPTDGGVIVIPDIGTVFKMTPLGTDLFVFASNGVWAISGSSGIGFTANDYAIKKVSSVPCISALSFVIVNYLPIWWNYDGIYGLQIDPVTQSASVQPLIETNIKSFYADIPALSKQTAKGIFNPITRIVQWLYESGEKEVSGFAYDRALNFNTVTGAYYPWSLPFEDYKPVVVGGLCVKGFAGTTSSIVVVDSDFNTVTDSNGNIVTISFDTRSPIFSKFFYTTFIDDGALVTFSEVYSEDYVDFSEIDYESYLISGYKVHADAIRKFQTNYVSVFSEREENSSLMFRARRSFSALDASGKFSNYQQAYKDDPNYEVTSRRLKVLGTGNVVQFECRSETGKPFNLIGYAVFETANQMP